MTKEDIVEEKDEKIKEYAQDFNVSSTSSQYAEKESQQDSTTIMDIPDNYTQNVN